MEEEFRAAEVAAVKMRQLFPDTDVGLLAERAPLLLVEEVDDIVTELRRYLLRHTSCLSNTKIPASTSHSTITRHIGIGNPRTELLQRTAGNHPEIRFDISGCWESPVWRKTCWPLQDSLPLSAAIAD